MWYWFVWIKSNNYRVFLNNCSKHNLHPCPNMYVLCVRKGPKCLSQKTFFLVYLSQTTKFLPNWNLVPLFSKELNSPNFKTAAAHCSNKWSHFINPMQGQPVLKLSTEPVYIAAHLLTMNSSASAVTSRRLWMVFILWLAVGCDVPS
jgi:hypothetical protein